MSTMPAFPQWNTIPTDPMADLTDEQRAALLLAPRGMFDPNAPAMPDAAAPGSAQELYKLMLAQAPYGSKERRLAQGLKRADALRNTAAPEGRHAGRVFVAANPLEFLGAGLERYAGERQTRDYEARQDELLRKRMRSLGAPLADLDV